MRTLKHKCIATFDHNNEPNGKLLPIYNINDNFFQPGAEPKQVYLTTILPGKSKGPHLHFLRTGFFTCIKGNVKIVLKFENNYLQFFSGEDFEYQSIEIPQGVAAMLTCIGSNEAYVLNMPCPAWSKEMNDEYTADFSDYLNGEGQENMF